MRHATSTARPKAVEITAGVCLAGVCAQDTSSTRRCAACGLEVRYNSKQPFGPSTARDRRTCGTAGLVRELEGLCKKALLHGRSRGQLYAMAQAPPKSSYGAPPAMLLSVAEARAARERARTGAAEKGQEAHRWLGERYRRLLESADAIGDLGIAARDATAFATAVEAKARDATAASQATPALPPPPAKITSPDAAAAKAAALAPELWRALDANDHGDAASCHLAVAALTTQAQGALGPVARMLRTRLLEATDAFLRTTDAESPSSVYAAAVAARVPCDACEERPGESSATTFSSSRDERGFPRVRPIQNMR